MGGQGGATGTGRDEEIADGGEDGDEPLQASRRSKAPHRPLASSQRQVRVLDPVVEALVRAMLDRGHDLAPGCGIGAELVGNHAPGRTALLLEKTRQQALCCTGVASRLDDFIEDISVLIDRPPQPMLFAADGDDDLVEVPDIAAARSLALEAAGIVAPELHRPPSHRLVGDDNAALLQHLLDQAKAQREAKVQPRRMLIQKELIARNGLVNGTIYLQVTRGSAPRTFNFPKSSPSIVMFTQKRDIVNLPEAKTGIGGLCCKDDRRRWEDGDKLDPISFMGRYRKER
jgi:hypothetical protein